MISSALHSSKTGKWDTPEEVVLDLARVFSWDVDVCASRPNVCSTYIDEGQDAFTREWRGLC